MTKMKSTLQEEWQECNEEHQEDRNDATPNPVKHGNEVVTAWLSSYNIALRINLTNGQLLVEGTDK